jgi:hypothetical protein
MVTATWHQAVIVLNVGSDAAYEFEDRHCFPRVPVCGFMADLVPKRHRNLGAYSLRNDDRRDISI